MNLSEEHTFVNFQLNNKDLKYARQDYVNQKFGFDIFSCYGDYKIVGFTLNQSKTKVIRIFYNRYTRPEGDDVCESAYYPIQLKTLNMLYPKITYS